MKSMTGYAQGRFEFDNFSFNISFKALNHKFLDLHFKGTGITPNSEKLIKDIVKNKIHRGKVEIVFNLFENDPLKWNIQFNEYLLEEILDKMNRFNRKNRYQINLSLDSLMKIPMIFSMDYVFENFPPHSLENIRQSISSVCDDFIESRSQEGEYILKDIKGCNERIRENLNVIRQESDRIEKEIFSAMKEKIRRFVKDYELDERRIAQEAAVAADKCCISEEISRLDTHSQRLMQLLESEQVKVKGREADFLAQEMLRETHTIASKTGSMDVHKNILLIRREIEKIRQQVQNVE